MTIVSLVIVNAHVITLNVKSRWGRRELGGGETATLTMQEKSFFFKSTNKNIWLLQLLDPGLMTAHKRLQQMKILLSPFWLSKMTRKLTCSGHHSQKYSILSKNPQMLFWEWGGSTGNTNELTVCYHSWKHCLLELRLSRKNTKLDFALFFTYPMYF